MVVSKLATANPTPFISALSTSHMVTATILLQSYEAVWAV
jgi:hypothetical protein